MVSAVFVSEYLYQSLIKLGLSTKKTYSINYNEIIKNIPICHLSSFYLGLFDGDGNIDFPKDGTISRSHVRLSAPIKQLQQLQEHMPFGDFCSIIEDKRAHTEPFGSLEAKSSIGKYCILKYLYSSMTNCLKRKQDNAIVLMTRIEQNVTNRAENIRAVKKWLEYTGEQSNG